MKDGSRTHLRNHRLRLSSDDAALLWGILDGFRQRGRATKERWPRLERILFDLEVMMGEREESTPDVARGASDGRTNPGGAVGREFHDTRRIILVRSDTGDGEWSLHAPGTSDEEIAEGKGLLLSGSAEWSDKFEGCLLLSVIGDARLYAATETADAQ